MNLTTIKDNYLTRIEYKKKLLKNAKRITRFEAILGYNKVRKEINVKNVSYFLRDLLGSSAWIGKSYYRYLTSYFNILPDGSLGSDPKSDYIIKHIASNKKMIYKFSSKDIFHAIYKERIRSNFNKDYKTNLHCPKINTTIVLVSGIFNEMFKTAAFERGARHLKEKNNIDFITPKISGVEGVNKNAEDLYNQLKEQIKKDGSKKFWLFAYSKGGIDCLHMLRHYKGFSKKHIVGLSTIASPILGTNSVDHKIFKLTSFLEMFSETNLFKYISEFNDPFVKEMRKVLSVKFQRPWFLKNHKYLPQNIFYTSVALYSRWYDSNILKTASKIFFKSESDNDGMVEVENAKFPDYFDGINLGEIPGHHWIGALSSSYCQEALIEAHIIFLNYLKMLK